MSIFGTYEKRNEQVESALKEAASLLDSRLGKGWGFTILGFTFGKGGDMFYVSNGQREDIIKAMKEFIKKNKQ